MAKAVGAALARLEPLIVEAGTGTGKTFAYLVPALLSGRSVIISTGTRTLQDQLFRRDVPMLAKALGLPAKIAAAQGTHAIICAAIGLNSPPNKARCWPGERGMARMLARVSRWAATTKAGDLVRAHRLAGAVDAVAEHHLDSRELPGVRNARSLRVAT